MSVKCPKCHTRIESTDAAITLQQQLATITAERDAACAEIVRLNKWADGFSDAQLKERQACEMLLREVRTEREECKRRAEAAEAERDALIARIEEAEKQEPLYFVWIGEGSDGGWSGTNKKYYDSVKDEDRMKLYEYPIPSPDTQELIRKAVEEEREACAKICDAQASEWDSDSVQTYKNYAGFCSSAIRSRSTKDKSHEQV